MKKRILLFLIGLAMTSNTMAGLLDDFKKKLEEANEGIDSIGQKVDGINKEFEDLNNEFEEMQSSVNDSVDDTKAIYTNQAGSNGARNAQANMQTTVAVKSFTDRKYTFDIKGIRLGETYKVVKSKYPTMSPAGNDKNSYTIDPSNKGFLIKFTENTDGDRYVYNMYMQQNLGASQSVSCENRAKGIESKLAQKYGDSTKRSVATDSKGTNYYSQWAKTTPGSKQNSKLLARISCMKDGAHTLFFSLIAKGQYIEESLNARKVNMQQDNSRRTSPEKQADF